MLCMISISLYDNLSCSSLLSLHIWSVMSSFIIRFVFMFLSKLRLIFKIILHTAHSYSKQRIMNPQNHAHVGHCRHGGGAGHSKHAQKCNCKGKLRHVAMHVSTIQIKTLHIQLDLLCTPQTNMGLNFKWTNQQDTKPWWPRRFDDPNNEDNGMANEYEYHNFACELWLSCWGMLSGQVG